MEMFRVNCAQLAPHCVLAMFVGVIGRLWDFSKDCDKMESDYDAERRSEHFIFTLRALLESCSIKLIYATCGVASDTLASYTDAFHFSVLTGTIRQ